MPAASKAFELADSVDYTQGFGMAAPGRGLPRVAGVGLGVTLDVAYRPRPTLSVGAEVQYQEFAFTPQENRVARGLTGNAGLTWHFRPSFRADPWVRIGSGYRLIWELDLTDRVETNVLRHGFELLAAKVGCDVRLSDELAIAPFAGVDLNLFVWEDPSGARGFAMSSPQWNMFVQAGVQGRFDIVTQQRGWTKLFTGTR